jgi:hypothetical protein
MAKNATKTTTQNQFCCNHSIFHLLGSRTAASFRQMRVALDVHCRTGPTFLRARDSTGVHDDLLEKSDLLPGHEDEYISPAIDIYFQIAAMALGIGQPFGLVPAFGDFLRLF